MLVDAEKPHRLGVAELGPYADEQCMPERVRKILAQDGDDNVIEDVVPRLRMLLEQNPSVKAARLCRANVALVHKLAREGETFCGYRNIQMLLRTLHRSRQYSIFDLQQMIEQAWDKGYNPHARIMTGGIVNTRKYIGTPEAEALLQSLGITCAGSIFQGQTAAQDLCASIGAYYGLKGAEDVRMTDKAPIFLQKPGHSVLVVGVVELDEGVALLVLDPAKPPGLFLRREWKSYALRRLFSKKAIASHLETEASLTRRVAFEMLSVD